MLEDTEAMVNILILVANFIIHARILIIFRLKKCFFLCSREKYENDGGECRVNLRMLRNLIAKMMEVMQTKNWNFSKLFGIFLLLV